MFLNLSEAKLPTTEKLKSTIYICLITGNSFMSPIIKDFTNSPFSHVGLSFDDSMNEIYTFNTTGFDKESFYNNKRYTPETPFSIYTVEVDSVKSAEFKAVLDDMYSQKKNYRYNYLGILTMFLSGKNKSFTNSNSFFCSEFTSWALEQMTGNTLFNKRYEFIVPADFTKNKNFKFYYRGKVGNYKEHRKNKEI